MGSPFATDAAPPNGHGQAGAAAGDGRATGSSASVAGSISSSSAITAPDGSGSHDCLIVGVDFGTTYSGVAAAYGGNVDDVDIIKTWPGGNGITSDKVPSEIAYDMETGATKGDAPSGGSESNGGSDEKRPSSTSTAPRNVRWGFQFKPEEPRLRCIKLFLDRNQKLPHFVSPLETATQLRRCDRTVMDAVSDYLAKIYEHTMATLARRYGDAFVRATPVRFVLTVPAVWSDAAKNATLQAAERAGMGGRHDVKLVSEPEAAAVYTLRTVQPSGLRVGNSFIVCDAGGGTVDLIAYRIAQLDPLRVDESATGTGALCGSAFLNYRFEDHVRERVGAARFEWMREKKPRTWNMGLRYFEEFVKRNFNEHEHSEVNVPLPGMPDDEEAGLDSGFLTMTAAQVKAIFEPVIAQVVELVEGQARRIREKGGVVSGIILVGGFGQSDYLYTQLKKHFNAAAPPPPYTQRPTHELADRKDDTIEVLQPMHAWTAVVRGAVLMGIEGSFVQSRRSRCHYGTSYATVYDESQHSIKDRYWSPLWERWMVGDRMQWHVAKGTPLSSTQPISFHYTRNFRPGQSLVVQDDLIACEDDKPPDAMAKPLNNVCTLTTDLSAVPRQLFTRLTTTKGIEFDNLDFELHMKIESASLVFELRVDGVKYGSVQAEFH